MAFDLHFSHEYAKLIQSLSIFLANESTSFLGETELTFDKFDIDIKEALQSLASVQDKDAAIKCAFDLKTYIDKRLQGAKSYGAEVFVPLLGDVAGSGEQATHTYYENMATYMCSAIGKGKTVAASLAVKADARQEYGFFGKYSPKFKQKLTLASIPEEDNLSDSGYSSSGYSSDVSSVVSTFDC